MRSIEEQLLVMKQEIDTAKEKLSELKGRKGALDDELKKVYGLNSVADAEKYVADTIEIINTFTAEIETGVRILEEKYNV